VQERRSLLRFAWLSIVAAVVTISLKGGAYLLTGSVGLLSDALESLVNLVAAVAALVALAFATRPPDEEHAYGHDKAEYFSSGFEGALILAAAVGIALAAVERLLNPQPLGAVGPALAVSALASLVNFAVARVLRRAGREYGSITLEADADHLMADVWTSVVVIAGVAAVAQTGWGWLDPLLALAVAANVLRTGVDLLRRSGAGLLDAGLPPEERAAIRDVLDAYAAEGLRFHALRTRQAGARRFASVHVLVPGAWTVQRGHDVVEQIEGDLRSRLPNLSVVTHLEPVEDPVSWADVPLDRADRA
jgi:cation diffusion facilitator family transporter